LSDSSISPKSALTSIQGALKGTSLIIDQSLFFEPVQNLLSALGSTPGKKFSSKFEASVVSSG
jgi:hypothetical protein